MLLPPALTATAYPAQILYAASFRLTVAPSCRLLSYLTLPSSPCPPAQILYADSFRLAVAPKSTDPLFLAFSIFVMVGTCC